MHAAVARLFLGDRAALLASAKAAGYTGEELPQRFVIAGHSGGGQLAAGAAGNYTRLASAERDHDLAGVLLLDTSPVGGAVSRGVANIPMDIPVYAIGAQPNFLEHLRRHRARVSGCATGQVRRGQAGRRQSLRCVADHQHAGPGLVGLVTGFPQPQNVEAVQDLAKGWITDWYETDPDAEPVGFYGPLGTTKDLATDAGVAHVYILPAPAPQLSPFDMVLKALIESTGNLNFATCAADPSAPQMQETAFLTHNSTPNTPLSLDGKARTGQSVGQHVCTG